MAGPIMAPRSALETYALRLADDNMVLAQRLGALIARMPELEEDIAVANLALDHVGQARSFYQYVVELASVSDDSDPELSEDSLAMLRDEREYLNSVLVEQPNGDFAMTMVRQLFFDAYQVPLYEALSDSSDSTLAAIAAKGLKEARYHLDHSSGWVVRLGDGTSESHRRTQAAVDALWSFTGDLFSADEVEAELVEAGVAGDPAGLKSQWETAVSDVMTRAKVTIPDDPYQRTGGRTGSHTEELGHMLAEMQHLYRSHPGAQW